MCIARSLNGKKCHALIPFFCYSIAHRFIHQLFPPSPSDMCVLLSSWHLPSLGFIATLIIFDGFFKVPDTWVMCLCKNLCSCAFKKISTYSSQLCRKVWKSEGLGQRRQRKWRPNLFIFLKSPDFEGHLLGLRERAEWGRKCQCWM